MPETPGRPAAEGTRRLREALGSEVVVHFQVEAAPAVSDEMREIAEDVDEGALLDELDHERRHPTHALRRAVRRRHAVKEGEEHEIAVAPGALRFFDPASGRRSRGQQIQP